MKRYFIPKSENSLEAMVSGELEIKPDKSVEITDLNRTYRKPVFTDETYTVVIETITQEEIDLIKRNNIPETPLWRIRTILKTIGQEENIEIALSSLPEPTKTSAEYLWNYGTVIDRNSQTVLFIQSILEMSDSEVDEIFNQANSISI